MTKYEFKSNAFLKDGWTMHSRDVLKDLQRLAHLDKNIKPKRLPSQIYEKAEQMTFTDFCKWLTGQDCEKLKEFSTKVCIKILEDRADVHAEQISELQRYNKELHNTLSELSTDFGDVDNKYDKHRKKAKKWKSRAKHLRKAIEMEAEGTFNDMQKLEADLELVHDENEALKAELDKIKEAHKVFLAAIEPEGDKLKVGDKVECLVDYKSVTIRTTGLHLQIVHYGPTNCIVGGLASICNFYAKTKDLKKL